MSTCNQVDHPLPLHHPSIWQKIASYILQIPAFLLSFLREPLILYDLSDTGTNSGKIPLVFISILASITVVNSPQSRLASYPEGNN